MTLGLLPDFQNTVALRYFFETARYGSFRLASEKIHIAASAISRQIQLLEEELGVKLFLRDRRSLRLTRAGELLLYRVKRVMSELGRARSEIQDLVGDLRGTVRLGINETVAREFLPAFLEAFRDDHPHIVLEFTVGSSEELADLLLRHEVDIIIGYAMRSAARLKHVASFPLRTCITVRTDHPLAGRADVAVADVVDWPQILPGSETSLRRMLDAVFAEIAISPRLTMISNSFELTAALVTAGHGVGWQVRLHTGSDPVRPDIMYVPVHDAGPNEAILACSTLVDVDPSPALTICLDALAGHLAAWNERAGLPKD